MKFVLVSVNTFILVYINNWAGAEDPCSNTVYSHLPRAVYRGGGCAYNKDKPTCDVTLAAGWYRAVGPNGDLRMQETAANLLTCGTKFAFWMEGTHPEIANGTVNRTLLQAGTSQTKKIQVKKCSDGYFVYNLEPTLTCPEAYCFGETDADPCPPFDPCDVYEYELVSYDQGRSAGCVIQNPSSCNVETFQYPWVVFRDADQGYLNISHTALVVGSCGSQSPMWIKETLSVDSDGIKSEKVCILLHMDNCSAEMTMRSKDCPWFTVYEVPTNVTCGRLCIDDPDAACTDAEKIEATTLISSTDPCSDDVYRDLPRADYRGGDCVYNDEKPVCDAALIPGWYRATGANGNLKMKETSAELFDCGTKFAVTLNGSHPTTAEGEVELALNQVMSGRTMSTTVKNCNDEYFVYKLKPTVSCPEGYCFGITENDPCPPFDPCDVYEHQKMEYDPARSKACMKEDSCVNEKYGLPWVAFRNSDGGFLNVSRAPAGVGSCFSKAPMWIKETISSGPDGVKVEKVCIESKAAVCEIEMTIESKSCPECTVYRPPIDVDCSRLCLDDQEPTCPDERPRQPTDGSNLGPLAEGHLTPRNVVLNKLADQDIDSHATKGLFWIIVVVLVILVVALTAVISLVFIHWRKVSAGKVYKVGEASMGQSMDMTKRKDNTV